MSEFQEILASHKNELTRLIDENIKQNKRIDALENDDKVMKIVDGYGMRISSQENVVACWRARNDRLDAKLRHLELRIIGLEEASEPHKELLLYTQVAEVLNNFSNWIKTEILRIKRNG